MTCLFFLISLWLYTTRCLLTVSPCRLTLVTSTNWSSFSNHLSGAMIGKEGGASRVDRNTRKYRPNKVVITGRHKSMWTKRLRCLSFLFFFEWRTADAIGWTAAIKLPLIPIPFFFFFFFSFDLCLSYSPLDWRI